MIANITAGVANLVQLRGINTYGSGPASNTAIVTTSAAPSTPFVVADTAGTAWSRVSAPTSANSARRFVLATKFTPRTNYAATRYLVAGNTVTFYLRQTSATALALRLTSSSVIGVSLALPAALAVDRAYILLVTVDGTVSSALPGDVVKAWLYDYATGTLSALAVSGTVGTSGGTVNFNPSTLMPNLDLFSANGSSNYNLGVEYVGVQWGDNSLTMPAPADATAMQAILSNANAPATLGAFQLAYFDQTGDESDWNSAGGLANSGTISSKPAVKQAGTYA